MTVLMHHRMHHSQRYVYTKYQSNDLTLRYLSLIVQFGSFFTKDSLYDGLIKNEFANKMQKRRKTENVCF